MAFMVKTMVGGQLKNLTGSLGGGEDKEDGDKSAAEAQGMSREEYEEYQKQLVEEKPAGGRDAVALQDAETPPAPSSQTLPARSLSLRYDSAPGAPAGWRGTRSSHRGRPSGPRCGATSETNTGSPRVSASQRDSLICGT
uniref:Complexin 3 n=1 Tax=Equus asinus TaxID=9793 RepID=A0A9L0K1V1_EQUAS